VPRGSDQARDVHVVAAGMHDEDLVARDRVDLLVARFVRQAGSFFDWQTVHVGAHHDQRPAAVLHHRDNAGAADPLRYLEASCAKFGSHSPSGLHFDQRQFRVAMEVIPECAKVRVVIFLDAVSQFVCGNRESKDQQRAA
jgi:hypothetical protein